MTTMKNTIVALILSLFVSTSLVAAFTTKSINTPTTKINNAASATTAAAFVSVQKQAKMTFARNQQLFMFSTEDDGKKEASPLEEVKEGEEVVAEGEEAAEGEGEEVVIKGVYKNLAKGGEITEVPWEDPAMLANSTFEMSWWAYILFGMPFLLLLNDVLHFLPTEGPLGFLSTL